MLKEGSNSEIPSEMEFRGYLVHSLGPHGGSIHLTNMHEMPTVSCLEKNALAETRFLPSQNLYSSEEDQQKAHQDMCNVSEGNDAR